MTTHHSCQRSLHAHTLRCLLACIYIYIYIYMLLKQFCGISLIIANLPMMSRAMLITVVLLMTGCVVHGSSTDQEEHSWSDHDPFSWNDCSECSTVNEMRLTLYTKQPHLVVLG